ncbi:FAD/NAD(P)-binding domain-containing protein [Lentithecium fluviatile CBS 122367]|uniref:FAD/NAD(P)-binding domain-containing protein n=1 Tax=Lentithecium fluviatile CBS 122367 TaxID=1168545 RepID=A0A6G1IEQ3_9PLEO|nr:FAD/NAD(P)-binding domain-containing protein [Lentithecium fluviatile CBS 122367]
MQQKLHESSDCDGEQQPGPLEVAIIGGGIVGLVLAAGLTRQNIKFKLYEQARNFRELGAGIGFTANTVQCMELINPDIVTALRAAGAVNISLDEEDPNAYFRWIDGYTEHKKDDPSYQKLLCKLDAGPKGWEIVRRDHFLENLVKLVPEDAVHLRKRVDDIEQPEDDEKLVMTFSDGSTAYADAVFACDGIKSRARKMLLGPDNPASYPQYSHKVAYRTLIPMKDVLPVLGEYKTMRHHMHVGPNAHLIHYPVNKHMVGATVVVTDPNDWSVDQPNLLRVTRKEVEQFFANWCKPVRDLVNLFPQELEQWALFDMYEYPVPQYNFGRICLAGDAAHASSPHHGAGASMGVEDILCLITLLRDIVDKIKRQEVSKSHALKEAFAIYNDSEWADPTKREKAESCFEELKDRSFKIWHFDPKAMVEETLQQATEKIVATSSLSKNGTSLVYRS